MFGWIDVTRPQVTDQQLFSAKHVERQEAIIVVVAVEGSAHLHACPPAKFASIFLRPKPGNSNPSWLSSSTSEASCLVAINHLNHNRLPKRLRYFFAQTMKNWG